MFFGVLVYADDIIPLTPNPNAMQELLNSFYYSSTELHEWLNSVELKWLCYNNFAEVNILLHLLQLGITWVTHLTSIFWYFEARVFSCCSNFVLLIAVIFMSVNCRIYKKVMLVICVFLGARSFGISLRRLIVNCSQQLLMLLLCRETHSSLFIDCFALLAKWKPGC